MPREPQIESSWKDVLFEEFKQPYMNNLRDFLKSEYEAGKIIYPSCREYFTAFNLTPFSQVRVVVIGQDPYHGPGQAHGLCFSVKPGIEPPPSLKNIFREQKEDLGIIQPDHFGCLESWARQGVLLLNAVLTVEQGRPGSHQGKGWEQFTDAVINQLNQKKSGLVFVLWGSYAQKKGAFIDQRRHKVLKAAHPSPLSAHRGFFGSRHFSMINKYLEQKGEDPIHWQLEIT